MPAKTAHDWDEAVAGAFNAGDADALVSLFEPDAVWVTEPGQSVRGRAAIAEAANGYFALGARIDPTTKAVLDQGELVLLYTGWSLTATGEDGPVELAGDSTVVLRRQPDGTLLAVVDDPWSSG